MSQTYDEYEQEYKQCLSRVRSFLSSHARSQTTLRECNRLLSQARRCASAMETLVEEGGADAFKIADSKRRTEREIMPLMQEVESALREKETGEIALDRNKADLFRGGVGYEAPDLQQENGQSEMATLIQNSESLLLESQALCVETEHLGSETLNTMGMQGEQLLSAREQLRGANSYVDDARHLLRNMNRKALRNKRFLYLIIAVLVVANVLAFIAVIHKHTKK